ncbi:MAG: dihydropteroate synthase [Dysgonomonadaceae bacterium]|nr:dihydropteroate synthase [Dysgonamonadaceae bacterium]
MGKSINIRGSLVDLSTPIVMGIVNITPDSFYAQSRKTNEKQIIERVAQILEEGGLIIDMGAQSTAPSSPFLSVSEEMARLRPALKSVRREFPDAVLSIDTFYSDVAAMASEEFGVDIINDISGGQIDERMFNTVARLNLPYILMHMRGTPQTMQSLTQYENFLQDILFYFSQKTTSLNQLGVNDIIIDPGFGFSKTLSQNYELMFYLSYFKIFEAPILVGISRKSMIYKLLETSANESLNGTSVLNTYSLLNGADILRVHEVKEAVECIKIVSEIKKFEK